MEKLTPSHSRREQRRRRFRRVLTIALILLASLLGENLVRRATAVNVVPDPAQASKPGTGAGSDGGAGSPWTGMLDWLDLLGKQYSGDQHSKHGLGPTGGPPGGTDQPHGKAPGFGDGTPGVGHGHGDGTGGGWGDTATVPGFGPGAMGPFEFTPGGFPGGPAGSGGPGGSGGASGGGPDNHEGRPLALADGELQQTGNERADVPEPDLSITLSVALGVVLIVRRMSAATRTVSAYAPICGSSTSEISA
jgi:hypothetical protein